MKYPGDVPNGPRNDCLVFGDDPDHSLAPGRDRKTVFLTRIEINTRQQVVRNHHLTVK